MGADSEGVVSERSTKLVLLQIFPQDLRNAWDVLHPFLERACAETDGDVTVEMVLANLEHWPLLAIANGPNPIAVMVVAVRIRADGEKSLECLVASGDMAKRWPEVDDQFDAFARALGCSRVVIPRARKGWVRALPHWSIKGYVLEREL